MSGLVTVYGIRQTMIGDVKIHLLINGNKVAYVTKNSSVDIPIDGDCVLETKCGINPGCGSFKVEDGMHTTLQMNYDRWSGKISLALVSKEKYGEAQKEEFLANAPIYNIEGARGRSLKVYEDKCVITTIANVGALLSGNVTDGEKTIYYVDVLGVQYKPCSGTLGYLQLETASNQMNHKNDNFFNENSFTFNEKASAKMEEVSKYVKQKVDEAKRSKNAPQVIQTQAVSAADELKKFKELLDLGVIAQEEFDAKKKQLLGL